jgi:hypothetical protein
LTPDVTVIGQIVRGEQAFCSQIGAPMSLPERFINRYQLKMVG